eukprot:TRINITY_DN12223_c0_g1_i1.p1 TRINITY_DN12223_c0_g1~~TRINITY_DN12223_c0_g1_i1.p1  ORF type:complete len:356 (+),score=35.93 TRINITY_DN12223_c0_g1_i1:26-1093(+)
MLKCICLSLCGSLLVVVLTLRNTIFYRVNLNPLLRASHAKLSASLSSRNRSALWSLFEDRGRWNCNATDFVDLLQFDSIDAPHFPDPLEACSRLRPYESILFTGDSLTHQLYQGVLTMLTGDWKTGTSWGRKTTQEELWSEKDIRDFSGAVCPIDICWGKKQTETWCRQQRYTMMNTSGVGRVCNGTVRMELAERWEPEMSTDNAVRKIDAWQGSARRLLVMSSLGLHCGLDRITFRQFRRSSGWSQCVTPILDAVARACERGVIVDLVLQDISPSGRRKPFPFNNSQSNARIAQHNAQMRDFVGRLHINASFFNTFPLIYRAESTCPERLVSSDGTHPPFDVVVASAWQFLNGV